VKQDCDDVVRPGRDQTKRVRHWIASRGSLEMTGVSVAGLVCSLELLLPYSAFSLQWVSEKSLQVSAHLHWSLD